MIKITSQLIKELENKLRRELKDNYMGLWSVAVCLVNKYFEYHPIEEYSYFTDYKQLILSIELLYWLGNNQFEGNNIKFNFEKILKKAERILEETKVKIYNRWINNDLKKVLSNAQLKYISNPKDIRTKYLINMLEDLIAKFPKYNGKNDWEFKEAIGLC